MKPICVFCKEITNLISQGILYDEFICRLCNSVQMHNFDTSVLINYTFVIDKYQFYFWPNFDDGVDLFEIYALKKNERDELLLTLNFIPDFTPQNMTEDKIKSLINVT